MKRIIKIVIIILLIITLFIINYYKKINNKNNLNKITLAEVTHSIFYAPQYVAINEGYFKDEGIDLELILASGADAVMSSLLSNDVDIGLCGTEATIYVYNQKEKDYIKTFAGLTKKDGSFLLSRKKYENFKLDDLKDKTILGGRKGGMPEMVLEWVLKKNNIIPNQDVKIDTSVAFAAMQGAFIGGNGDFVTLFEPNALNMEKNNHGFVVAYIGQLAGDIPYTAYSARKSFIENNPLIIEKFNNAVNRGLKYVEDNDANTIANSIISYFPETSKNDLIKIITRYKNNNAWKSNTTITKKEFNHLQDIMISSGNLDKYVSYNDLIYSKHFANNE